MKKLLSTGDLVRFGDLQRATRVTAESVDRVRSILSDPGLMTSEAAATHLGLTRHELKSGWVQRAILPVTRVGEWMFVSKLDVDYIEALSQTHLTAADAGRELGMHRTHFANLERRGLITSMRVGKRTPLRMYARADVAKLKSSESTRPFVQTNADVTSVRSAS